MTNRNHDIETLCPHAGMTPGGVRLSVDRAMSDDILRDIGLAPGRFAR
ncbi:MAG: hypothetical protein M0Q22_00395 [Sulfuritalea sp.]|jgi:hypothetical protein|nr:hypothetical protein [Sulfuritalea sp.]